jgi:hypothetical protein
MKALQDKIKECERENAFLKEKEKMTHERNNEDKKLWEQKIQEEITKCGEVENKLRTQINHLEDTNSGLKVQNKKIEEDIMVIVKELNIEKAQKERHLQMNAMEKQELNRKLDSIEELLSEKDQMTDSIQKEKELLQMEYDQVFLFFHFFHFLFN